MSSSQSADPDPSSGVLQRYAPVEGLYDEMMSGSRTLRHGWQRFAQGLDSLGPTGLAQRAEQMRRLLRENGVTYSVHGGPQGPDRPWELDPLPLLFSASEWQRLSVALAQRAHLLNAIAADIYGQQRLLKSRLLPPELVFGHRGFLFACQQVPVVQNTYLHLYAAHLARGPDGHWLALADRTQGPSGAGYAVENRLVISRTLPDDFHSLYVERLAGFFMLLRETLQGLARRNVDNPRVVLLSPGQRSVTYFEDSYLARYLGFTLVEGADLTVRSTGVFLKTLGGLLPVDVVWRRLADEDCDPLELRADAWSGVPGLVHCARNGQVSVANALGSGWLESPALMAFLPTLCKELLGEELRLHSVPTWWCGRPENLRFVDSHIEQLVIRPVLHRAGARPVIAAELSQHERTELLARIHADPPSYVAQVQVARSTAPVWNGGALQPWHVGIRAFAVSTGDSYEVMPGGLSRVSSSPSTLGESMTAGQGSKDVWVLSDHPVAPISLLEHGGAALELRRSANDLPSRVADNLYWLGRLVERAESSTRHLRCIVVRMTGEFESNLRPELHLLLQALIRPGDDHIALQQSGGDWESSRHECRRFVFQAADTSSIAHTLRAVRRTASTLRDRLSVDSYRIINQLDLDILYPWPADKARLGDLLLLLNQLLSTLLAISGLTNENMTRGPGWRFLDMGRRVERAHNMLRLLRRTLVPHSNDLGALLEALLEIGDSTMTYRNRYLMSLQLSPILDLLLLDDTNPRSVSFQVRLLSEHVNELRLAGDRQQYPAELELSYDAQRQLRMTDADALVEVDEHQSRAWLDRFLAQLSTTINALGNCITHTYFTHTVESRQLGQSYHGGAS